MSNLTNSAGAELGLDALHLFGRDWLKWRGVGSMREIFYTDAEINDALRLWAPKLRDFSAACRQRHRLPDRDSLSKAQREQFRILCSILTGFRDAPIRMPEPHLEIYHGSAITLLAVNEVFGPESPSIVALLSEKRERVFVEIFKGADGWYSSTWVTFHDQVPTVFTADVASFYPPPDGFRYWVLTMARAGRASHELWKWDEAIAAPIGVICEQLTEEGFIDNFQDFDVSH